MWEIVRDLRADGVTIILTTHYIEEAEAMADRIAVINDGRILLVEDKVDLMTRMGSKEMRIELQAPVSEIPESLTKYALTRTDDPCVLVYTYDTRGQRGITTLLDLIGGWHGFARRGPQSSLEDIFVSLLGEAAWRTRGFWRSIALRFGMGRTLVQSLISPVISTAFCACSARRRAAFNLVEGRRLTAPLSCPA